MRYPSLTIFLTVFLAFALTSCNAHSYNLPSGWIDLPEEKVAQTWRNVDKNMFISVRGDFNGDSIDDLAKILTDSNKEKVALFVFLSKTKDDHVLIKLNEKEIKYIDVIGIELFQKGRYRERGEKTFHEGDILFKNDSIKYFKYEGAYGVFRWNSKTSSFEFVGLND